MIRMQYQGCNRRNSSPTLEVGVFLLEKDKQILARILKYSVEEFKEYDILEIINRIEEVEILEVPVDAGLSHKSKNELFKK